MEDTDALLSDWKQTLEEGRLRMSNTDMPSGNDGQEVGIPI